MSVKSDEPLGPPEPEPPPREFHLKPTEFERVNPPTSESPEKAIDVQQILRQANSPPPTKAPGAAPPRENEVHAILRENVAREKALELNSVIPQRRRPSRRKRDYWLLLVGGNLLVVGAVSASHRNVVIVAFGFSAMVFCSLALTWIMWFVMDDY